jgi:hypothetical protein
MQPKRPGKRWPLHVPALILWIAWSALWLTVIIVTGAPTGPVGIAIFGFLVLGVFWLGTRQEGKIKDWERRKREAEALEALQREALESKEFEREVVELERKDRRV